MKYLSESIFAKELETLERLRSLLSENKSSKETLELELKNLIEEFSNTITTSSKLAKVSDNNEKRLIKAQERSEKANILLKEKNQSLTLLSEVGKLVTSSLEMKDILNAIYNNLKSLIKIEILTFGLFEEQQNCIKYKNILVKGEYLPGMQKDSLDDDNLSSFCFKSQKEFISNNLEKDFPHYKKSIEKQTGETIDSVAYFPLKAHDEIIGILTFQNTEKDTFSESTIGMLRDMANFIAIGVDNANAYKKLSKRNKELKGTLEEIRNLNEKAENLLLNILPKSTAERLKKGEITIADYFPQATVLFADIVGFSKLSVDIGSPEKLVSLLNDIFTVFDSIAERYKLEKIKTIGDCYMLAGGVPDKSDDHAFRSALASLEMIQYLDELHKTGSSLNFRIGLHSGDVVAGVIGKKKFVYDLWGDTVNTASRMESHGRPGRIHCTKEFFELTKDKFLFEDRGEMEVKGKGIMHTYFLNTKK
ncbi:MAG: adenylate/guanylate cyclase domain-containing protein [Leptospiraceae bacterium]|nr:adenylate/guanylate cyclase domain-containing protein [Leptospiraceae bacterium]